MKRTKKNLRDIVIVFVVLFAIAGGFTIYMAASSYVNITSPHNIRVNIFDETVQRGSIYDYFGEPLAISVLDDYGFERIYPFNHLFSHTVGYSGMSRFGLELSRNFDLYNINFELWQRIRYVVTNQQIQANGVKTTLDAGLQQLIYDGLGGSAGAVVVLNYQTGAILAMVSNPSFDANTVGQDWSQLITDANSPLINRATQGLYPPGSTFKVITAIAALEDSLDWLDFEFYCTGSHIFGEFSMQCAFGNAHGHVDMARAMAVSCNGFFAYVLNELGAGVLMQTIDEIGFLGTINLEIASLPPQFHMQTYAETDEIIQTAIGQGRTLITPLYLAMLAAAIANDGQMMQPFIVDSFVTSSGNIRNARNIQSLGQMITSELAEILNAMLIEAVTSGTGRPAYIQGGQISGKTGTAENATGIDHSLFIGSSSNREPIALAIVIENTGGGPAATNLAARIFGYFH